MIQKRMLAILLSLAVVIFVFVAVGSLFLPRLFGNSFRCFQAFVMAPR